MWRRTLVSIVSLSLISAPNLGPQNTNQPSWTDMGKLYSNLRLQSAKVHICYVLGFLHCLWLRWKEGNLVPSSTMLPSLQCLQVGEEAFQISLLGIKWVQFCIAQEWSVPIACGSWQASHNNSLNKKRCRRSSLGESNTRWRTQHPMNFLFTVYCFPDFICSCSNIQWRKKQKWDHKNRIKKSIINPGVWDSGILDPWIFYSPLGQESRSTILNSPVIRVETRLHVAHNK